MLLKTKKRHITYCNNKEQLHAKYYTATKIDFQESRRKLHGSICCDLLYLPLHHHVDVVITFHDIFVYTMYFSYVSASGGKRLQDDLSVRLTWLEKTLKQTSKMLLIYLIHVLVIK